jgi:hypothetical protein
MRLGEPDDDAAIAWIDIAKVNEIWKVSMPDDYLGHGNGSRETYKYLRDAVEGGAILRMPCLKFLYVQNSERAWSTIHNFPARIGFVDGRHRFVFMRDHGASSLPVTLEDNQADLVDKYLLSPRGPHVTKVKV